MNRRPQQWMCVLWPGFLAACAAEFVVFALIDPSELHWGGAPLTWSREAVYAGAFFVFWALCAASSALTLLLLGAQQGTSAAGEPGVQRD